VGLENYIRLFHDRIFLGALWNTFYFILLTVPDLVVSGLTLALVLQKRTRMAAMLRGVFFSSSVLSVTIVTTKNQDYAAATAGFLNGAGGVYLVGTWMIGDFDAECRKPNRPLSNGYTVMMYPQLYPRRDAVFSDGHAWVMPAKKRTPAQRQAVFRLLKFMAGNNNAWARTGHLPAMKAMIDSKQFYALPHRHNIAKLATVGTPLAVSVQRQFTVQDIVGEEMAAAVTGQKPIDTALADAELRVNELLSHLP
jgi:multiple sugar transport system substrate-binding protein